MLKVIIFFICAYLAGSINFAIILFKISGKGDPRDKYSGNAGTTNVYRQAGKVWAAIILLLDFGRAVAAAVLCLYTLQPEYAPFIGFGLILGNRFPCFHQLRGGKGVANYLGFTAVIAPVWAAVAAAVWVLIYIIMRIPFIASLFMIMTLVMGTMIISKYNTAASAGAIITGLFIIFNHKKNIIEFNSKRGRQ